ncbi:hypothetical protein [Niveispirillum irakense]|uniref:hypothetical protein n=1 Tax=Niveispirillum irakense TaxID=34011 RepID=UPI0006868C04|nr:hypothetical protein [Niveispirillum irakense]
MNTTQARVETLLIRQGHDMLNRPERWGYVALLIAALAMAATLTALLVTETSLPTRTMAAFATMLVMALCWVAHAGWVLTHRRPLYGRHKLTATRLATGFSALYTLGAGLLWSSGIGSGAAAATLLGCLMLSGATVLHIKTRRQVAILEKQRRQLESAY